MNIIGSNRQYEASANQNGYPLGGPGLLEDNDDVRAEESKTYTNEGISPEARIKDDAAADQNSYTLRNTDSLEHNNVVRTEEQEKCKGDNINKDTSTETMIIDKLDTQAMIEANNKRGNTMNNFRNQGRNDLHINGNSINTIPFIQPPGSVVYRERLVSYNRKTYCLRYEYIIYNDPVKHEGASSDPQVTKHETYNGAKIEEEAKREQPTIESGIPRPQLKC